GGYVESQGGRRWSAAGGRVGEEGVGVGREGGVRAVGRQGAVRMRRGEDIRPVVASLGLQIDPQALYCMEFDGASKGNHLPLLLYCWFPPPPPLSLLPPSIPLALNCMELDASKSNLALYRMEFDGASKGNLVLRSPPSIVPPPTLVPRPPPPAPPTEPRRPTEPRCPTEPHCPACTAPAATASSTTTAATAATTVMASPTVLTFDAEGRAVDFDVWVDDLQLFLQCDSRDGVSLFDHTSGVSTAPTATADSTVRSQWTTRDAAARLAVRSHLPPAERAHFGQYKTALSLYDAVVARYSSPATAALSRLMLPYLFPDLAAFATVADLVAHLRTSDARYRAALPT
ncbi:unnamed protein product, partial [Closterium sp. NIES-53]